MYLNMLVLFYSCSFLLILQYTAMAHRDTDSQKSTLVILNISLLIYVSIFGISFSVGLSMLLLTSSRMMLIAVRYAVYFLN